MKRFFTFLFAAALSVNAFAQSESQLNIALPKGANVIDCTVGVLSSYLPFTAHYEHIVADFGKVFSVGVGAELAAGPYVGTSLKDCFALADVLGAFHYSPIRSLDLNAGVGIGYYTFMKSGFLHYTGFIGARYFFTDVFGVKLQFFGSGIVNCGVSFKF